MDRLNSTTILRTMGGCMRYLLIYITGCIIILVATTFISVLMSGCGQEVVHKHHNNYYKGEQGPAGPQGNAGPVGAQGRSCEVIDTDTGLDIVCKDSSASVEDGVDGKDGAPGQDAEPCAANRVDGGVVIQCGEDVVTLLDGEDGADAVAEIIDPCGPHKSGFDEVLLVTSDNKILAYFEHGSKRFLSSLTPGFYQTTDSQGCLFEITEQMEVIEHDN